MHDPLTLRANPLSVAPMMDWTDRHCRYFLRLLSPRAVLYTEMVTTGAILFGDRARFLDFDPTEHPVVLQLGGSEPDDLARCARLGAEWGYDAINLNCGCPSDRVQSGRFGACLMAEPAHVARCVSAMADAAGDVPVTVKCRIGIEPKPDPDRDEYEALHAFVAGVTAAGAGTIVLHARTAVLAGLSPKENREIPPLRYGFAYRLKQDFPDVAIIVNGGVASSADVTEHLARVDGVMLGRIAYQEPYRLAEIDAALFGSALPSRHEAVDRMLPYIETRRQEGAPLNAITRHMLGLFNGMPGARRWRRMLSEQGNRPGAGPELVRTAAACVTGELLSAA
jgi:tRNA-dihydrouridine synthase A